MIHKYINQEERRIIQREHENIAGKMATASTRSRGKIHAKDFKGTRCRYPPRLYQGPRTNSIRPSMADAVRDIDNGRVVISD